MSTDNLINALSRQDIKLKSYRIRRKINRLNLKKIGKKTKCFKKRLSEAKKLHNMPIDDLKKIAILRRIRN